MQNIVSVAPMPTSEPRLLVIEPDPKRRAMLIEAVNREGYDLLAVETADDVLRNLEVLRPDIVVLSFDLGRMTGAQLCGELRAREVDRHTPVVIVGSGQNDEATVGGALLAGADDFVQSPSRGIELRARVRVHLRYKNMLNRLGALRQQRDHLRREALYDPLTGLLNRRGLEDAVDKLVRASARFAALFIDIDHFKKVNDAFGHAAGDEVLRQVAARMQAGARQNDVCARYGGEEFVILLAGADELIAQSLAEQHRRAVESLRFEDRTLPPRVTVSIGGTTFSPSTPEAVEVFLERADHALYAAKEAGRNRVVIASVSKPPPPMVSLTTAVEAQLLMELHGGRAQLPVLPDVAQQVMRLAEDSRTGSDTVAKLVEKSPPHAARVLALSNSAMYAGSSKVATLRQAVTRLGLAATRDLLLQIAYESSIAGMKRYVPVLERIYKRSVTAAVAGRIAGKELGLLPDYGYLIGLLHDIGEAHVIRLLADQPGPSLDEPELTALAQRHHQRGGAQVLRAWKIPEEIVTVAMEHHSSGPSRTPALRLARITDAIASAVLVHDSESNWADLDVGPEMRTRLITATKDVVSKV